MMVRPARPARSCRRHGNSTRLECISGFVLLVRHKSALACMPVVVAVVVVRRPLTEVETATAVAVVSMSRESSP